MLACRLKTNYSAFEFEVDSIAAKSLKQYSQRKIFYILACRLITGENISSKTQAEV